MGSGCGNDPIRNQASTSQVHRRVNEEEEMINRAIALSLAEEEEKRKRTNSESQLKEDEQLAREPQPIPAPLHVPLSTGDRVCAGCHKEMEFGRFLRCMDGIWHPECFRCHFCKLPISDSEFSTSNGHPYHRACFREQYHPKCGVCNQFISSNSSGVIEYRSHPFWDQKYCPRHETDGTIRCCSCERMEPHGTGYISLGGGRRICIECKDSSIIMDTNQCQPLYLEIQKFYESVGMKVEQEIPLLLVERQALSEATGEEKHGHHHIPETRGLCLSEEHTFTTVVTGIHILFGLPRLLTGSILASLMMHAWLRLRGYKKLNPRIEEGICQVMAHMWLETQLSSGASNNQEYRSPFELKLGKFFKNKIESDVSPIYGDGFRAANQVVVKYGLKSTLDHLQLTGTLPY